MAKDVEIYKLQVTSVKISNTDPSGSLWTAQLPGALDLGGGGQWLGGRGALLN